MQGFPPAPDARVTLGNWQTPPYNRWAFSHLREIVPTQRIARGDGPVLPLPADPQAVRHLLDMRSGIRPLGDALICLGINGQMLYVNPGTRTVAAKTSSWPVAQSPVMLLDTLAAFDAVAAELTGREAVPPPQPGPPGVAAGVSRRRATA